MASGASGRRQHFRVWSTGTRRIILDLGYFSTQPGMTNLALVIPAKAGIQGQQFPLNSQYQSIRGIQSLLKKVFVNIGVEFQ